MFGSTTATDSTATTMIDTFTRAICLEIGCIGCLENTEMAGATTLAGIAAIAGIGDTITIIEIGITTGVGSTIKILSSEYS